jgi:chemotaxis protein CheC
MATDILSKTELDQLAEITNIGAGNASTALSHMLGKKVQMTVPETFVGDLTEIQRLLGKTDDTVLAVFLKMHGDIEGALAMIFPPASALDFAELLTKNKRDSLKEFEEIDRSALREVGNILLGASITALGKFLNLNIVHSVPDVASDMLGAIMDSILIEMGSSTERILAFKINLHLEEEKIGSDLYYMFDPNSTKKILDITKSKTS